ncbi:MAG: hypothetical protein ACFFC7_02810, partial [Candidatus Hermodarchaeota archaeon]
DSENPSLAIDEFGHVHVVWADYTNYINAGTDRDIFYKRWNATTSTWTPTEVVSTESTSDSENPSLAIDEFGHVHVVWADYTNYTNAGTDRDIFYKRWNVTTSTWMTTEVVSTESTSDSKNPSLAIGNNGALHVVWADRTDYVTAKTDWDIFYKNWESITGWKITQIVSTESTSDSDTPALTVEEFGHVHVVWADYTNYTNAGTDRDIFYKRWNATMGTWTPTEVVSTESTSNSYTPALGMDGNRLVHVVWCDDTDYGGSLPDRDIFYKHWKPTTNTWITTWVVSQEGIAKSDHPKLSIDENDELYFVWEDWADYNGAGTDVDIFYRKFESSPPPVGTSPDPFLITILVIGLSLGVVSITILGSLVIIRKLRKQVPVKITEKKILDYAEKAKQIRDNLEDKG